MSFNPNPPKAEYQATAGQTNFPFLFKIYFTSDIKVYHTPISTGTTVLLTEGIDYSVVINGDDGGTVTLILVVENNDYIVLERELELTRYVEYQTSGDLLAGTLNADQDYQTYLTSDQNAIKDNSLRLPQGTFGVDTVIPSPEAGYFFKWSADGKSVEYGAPSTVTVPWGNITGILSDQTDLQNALDAKLGTNDPTYTGTLSGPNISTTFITSNAIEIQGEAVATVAYADTKLPIADPIFTGTMTGSIIHVAGGTIHEYGSAFALEGSGLTPGSIAINDGADSTLELSQEGLFLDDIHKVVVEDAYATSSTGGTIKILVSGTDCYITTDGSTPGP